MRRATGYVLWSNPRVVAIATGFGRKSKNRKTGDMVQVWIIRRDLMPTNALLSGKDRLICGDCPLRGFKGKERTCYVNVVQAPQSIYKAYKRGRYPKLTDNTVFKGRMVRLGAYGDPAFVPVGVWRHVLEHAKGWTGYTHQWRKDWAGGLKGIVMASCDSLGDQYDAQAVGWRTFRVRSDDEIASDEIQCPEARVSCEECGLCCGNHRKARNISIKAHGTGKRFHAELA